MTFPTTLPPARTPDRRSAPALRWGLLGTGWIADKFATALHEHTDQVVQAVGSRSQGSADRFASGYGVTTAHGSYEALVDDPDVDVVYVATPHPQHVEHALLAIEAGKPVLVEKPMAINAAGAEQIAAAARAQGVFAMEAMWTLALPKMDVVRQLVDDGALGELYLATADLGEYFDPSHRIYDPQLAGGAMLDLATYPITFATWALGEVTDVSASGMRAPTGVMGQVGVTLTHRVGGPGGQSGQGAYGGHPAQSVLYASMLAQTPTTATVAGADGYLAIDGFFFKPGGFTLTSRGGQVLRYDEPTIGNGGLSFEACDAARCIGEGLLESPRRPLDATIDTLRVMDRVRAATGDRFVMEA